MQDRIAKYLFDISESIDSIEDFIGMNKDFNLYIENKILKRAVEREIGIIGEAVNKIIQIDTSIKIRNARKIIDTRNHIIHGYDKVDDVIIWGIVIKYLPLLKKEISELLDDINK